MNLVEKISMDFANKFCISIFWLRLPHKAKILIAFVEMMHCLFYEGVSNNLKIFKNIVFLIQYIYLGCYH